MPSRVLEPEVMDTAEEAADYDAMDHGDVNRAFCDDLLAEAGVDPSKTLDLGTGTALIAIALCRRVTHARVVAVDLAGHMVVLAKANAAASGLADRIELHLRDAKATGFESRAFSLVMSNSLVHHLPDPLPLFLEIARLLAPGGAAFVRDLVRPEDERALVALVETYAPLENGLASEQQRARAQRQRALFEASLRAALSEEEVRAFARAACLEGATVRRTSDRHFTLVYRAP